MHDIFLSTPSPSGASATGLSVGGAQGAGVQTSGESASFGATLTGVFHSVLSPEKLDEISSKLEALGVDTSFMDGLNSMLSGNLMAEAGGQEGMPLPQLHSFLQNSFAELEKMLNQSMPGTGEETSDQLSDELLSSLGEIIESIQKTIEPAKAPTAVVLSLPENADAVSVSTTASASIQPSDVKRQLMTGNSQGQSTLNTSSPGSTAPAAQVAEGDTPDFISSSASMSKGGDQLSNLPAGERSFNNALDEQFSKILSSDMTSESNAESVLEKLVSNVKDKSSAASFRTTFSDAQSKLESTPYSTTVMTGLDDIAWGEEVGQKIVWFTGKAIQSAEIHLNPAELGPIDVKISVQNDTAAVTFNAHNASVREMLESNVVRLREMMETNGVDLQEVNVDARQGDERFASNDQQQGGNGSSGNSDEAEASAEAAVEQEVHIQTSSNIVDYFA